jgi:hypothetical protein
MEGLMASVVALDASPSSVLRSLHGAIIDARIAYPDVLHVAVKDSDGDVWELATQGADWSPRDPKLLIGLSLEGATIDEASGEMRFPLSDGSALELKPFKFEAADDPPNWEVITPNGLVLEFGPGLRWQISGADAPASSRS